MKNKCSRAGCAAEAKNWITWRNPKIHTDGRTKLWSGCDDHTKFLIDYLDARGFFLSVSDSEDKQ